MAPAEYTGASPVDVSRVPRDRPGENVFLIPDEGRYILYAPLHHFVAAVNATTARLVQGFLASGDPGKIPEAIRQQLDNLAWAEIPDNLPEIPDPDRPYEPCHVTIFPTNQCMLRCEYCYASSGEKASQQVDLGAARAAIDLVIDNAQRKEEIATVAFHGGCDPLWRVELLKECVGHACAEGERRGAQVRLVIATSGAVSEASAQWLAKAFHSVCLSCDGPPDIQDRQRPLANGSPSSPMVQRTAEILRDHNIPCGIRATVTKRTVHRMKEMVDYFVDVFGMRQLHFEPVHSCGRCVTTSVQGPSPEDYVQNYCEAWEHARERGAMLRYSGCRLGWLSERFCSVDGDNFCLTTDGHVSACYEVPDTSHPLADTLIFGRFDPPSKRFIVDRKKLVALRELNVGHKEYCQRCFAKWNCAGDCPIKCLTEHCGELSDYSDQPGARCQVNKELTRWALRRALESPREPSDGRETAPGHDRPGKSAG